MAETWQIRIVRLSMLSRHIRDRVHANRIGAERLTTIRLGRALRLHRPEGSRRFWALSITSFVMGATLSRNYPRIIERFEVDMDSLRFSRSARHAPNAPKVGALLHT
jgi:predicted DNA-binding WGR domain protein